MKRPFRLVLFLLILSSRAFAQDGLVPYSYNITLDLLNVSSDKDRMRVTILTPAIKQTKIRYILPEYIPGIAGKVDAGRFIHQFYALDDQGVPLKVKKRGNNIIEIRLRRGASLRKIEYWIDDTWDMEKEKAKMSDAKFNYVPQSAGTNIDARNCFLINHAFIFGYLEGLANIPYNITIIKPDELEPSSALNVRGVTKGKDEYHTLTYYELLDNPVMYSLQDSLGFQAGDIYFNISVFSENGKIKAMEVRKLIAAQLIASAKFLSGVPPQTYRLIFYFTTPFKTVLNRYGGYGGSPHKHCAFYFLPELVDEDALSDELVRVISDDVMHVLSPLDHLSFSGNPDLLRPQFNQQWWFTEGVSMYFGWLSAVRDSFINETEFMGAVSSAIKLSLLVPHKPITDRVMLASMMRDPLKKEAIRSKAMLTAFLLDILITRQTGGLKGLRELLIEMNDQHMCNSDSLQRWLVSHTTPAVKTFLDNYVNDILPLPLIEEFDQLGWAYAPSSIDSVLTFGKFGLIYSDEKDAFVIYQCDTANLFGLQDGDRLLSVDGVIVGALNYEEALAHIYSPFNDDPITIHIIRNDKNIAVTAQPKVNAVSVEHLIKPDPAASDDAFLLHMRIFHPIF